MADQTLAKYVNERSILTMLRLNGGTSRASISRALSLTPATISRLTSDMLQRGLLQMAPANTETNTAEREPGRPGVDLAVNPDGAYFFGVEIGVSVLRFVLIDLCAIVVESLEEPVDHLVTPEESVKAIARVLKKYRSRSRYRDKINAGAITLPGLVSNDGYVVNLPILGWKDTNLQQLLTRISGLSFSIENNSNAAAFGAVYTQHDVQVPCTLFLKLGTGCGGAAIVNGRLLRGADGTGMEFGHIGTGALGVNCGCGQRGCLETWVNLAALARAYYEREPRAGEDLLSLPQLASEAFERGEKAALRAVDSIASHLTTALVTLVNIFNPSQIVLSGAMRPVLACCLSQLSEAIADRTIPGTRMPDIQLSHLGEFECAIGAACVSHHKAFDISNVEISNL